jgi:hypothetical protein
MLMASGTARQLLRQEFEALRTGLWSEWSIPTMEWPPPLLYHYTDGGGLLGILSSRHLWATDIRYLNDARELTHACDLVEEVLQGKLKERQPTIVQKFLSEAVVMYSPYEAFYTPYVTCFCEKGDLLSQWRGYAERGSGYSIGFDGGALATNPKSANEILLRKVKYIRDEQVRLIRGAVELIVDTLAQVTQGMTEIEAQADIFDAHSLLRDILGEYLVCFKHPGFEEEQEWRLVHRFDATTDPSEVKIRSVRGLLVPYVELPIAYPGKPWMGRDPIVSITHGPTLHPDLSEKSLRLLLLQHKESLAGVQIEGSTVPLRA